jgi:hypothetical protein
MAVLWVSGQIVMQLSIGIVLFLLLLRSLDVSLTAIDYRPHTGFPLERSYLNARSILKT